MEKQEANAYLASEPVGKLLRRFSLPCVLSMLVSALYNIVDQIFIGQGVGYLGNAATNVVYPFTVLALALALLAGDGCAALLSLSQGRGDAQGGHRSVGNGIVLIVIAGLALTALGAVFREPLLRLFGVTEACYGYAREYYDVILIGIPFYAVASGLNAAIRADGSPGYSMFATILGAVLNLILDPVAIFVFDAGVRGAAIATVIGQVASCEASIAYFRRPKSFALRRDSFRLRAGIVRRIAALGISSFIIQTAIVVVMTVANNIIVALGPASRYGADIPLSVVGIVMKVFSIVIAISVGISVGGQPIVGYNYGAGNHARVRQALRLILLANIIVGALATLLFEFCPQAVIALFGSESALYNEYAVLCFRIFLAGILLTCIQKASSIFLQAIGRPVKSTLLSLSRDVIFFIPGLFLFSAQGGVTGMLWAAPVADLLSALLACILLYMEFRGQRKTMPEVMQSA